MSQAPGDLPLETHVVAGKRGRFASKSAKWRITLLAVLAILAGGAWWWRSIPTPLRWVDIREGEGSILSIATGRDPDGNEIIVAGGYWRTDDTGRDLRVVCYDAANGHVRWEARENQALADQLSVIRPNVSIDPAGDVYVGREFPGMSEGDDRVVWKYSGRDGLRLWDWEMKGASRSSIRSTIPSQSRTNALWVSVKTPKNPEEYRQFLAALDPKTGVALWQLDLNRADEGIGPSATIHPLRDGGAILVMAPMSGLGMESRPWIIERRSNDGGLVWEHQIVNLAHLDVIGDSPILIDATQDQLVLVSQPLIRAVDYHFVTLDLKTGHERSHKSERLSYGAEFVVTLLAEPGTEAVKKAILYDPVRGSWRAAEMDFKSLFSFFARQPGGIATSTSFPDYFALTPSGGLVLTGTPVEEKRQWQIRVW